MSSVLFTNAAVVTESGILRGGVETENGVITAVFSGRGGKAERTVDCGGLYLMPGVIDTHVHFREPGPNEREDFTTGTMSAAAGGVTCVIDHPLDVPPVLDGQSFDRKAEAVREKACVDYGFWGGVTGKNLERLPELAARGVFGLKAFLCASDPLFPMVNDGELLLAMEAAAAAGLPLGLHAENDGILSFHRQRRAPGPWQAGTHSGMRPVIAELEAVSRALLFARETGVKLHILHLGIYEGAELIRQARQWNVDVTVETCPHYLCLPEEIIGEKGADGKCCPPLRDREHMERLWGPVLDGTIDMVVSDHSPYTAGEKACGPDLSSAPPGLTGVQTGLQVMLSEGVCRRGMSLQQLSRLMSGNPAKRFGLYGRKGAIRCGFDADFALVDLRRPWKIEKEDLFYKNKNSAFAGMEGTGKPVASFVRGKCVWSQQDGFPQGPGYGRLLRRDGRGGCEKCH